MSTKCSRDIAAVWHAHILSSLSILLRKSLCKWSDDTWDVQKCNPAKHEAWQKKTIRQQKQAAQKLVDSPLKFQTNVKLLRILGITATLITLTEVPWYSFSIIALTYWPRLLDMPVVNSNFEYRQDLQYSSIGNWQTSSQCPCVALSTLRTQSSLLCIHTASRYGGSRERCWSPGK